MRLLLLLLQCGAVAFANRAIDNPGQMLVGMFTNEKTAQETLREKEAKAFRDFRAEQREAIIKAEGEIERATRDKTDADEDNATRQGQIRTLNRHINKWNTNIKHLKADRSAATQVRAMERADHENLKAQYRLSIDATNKAIDVIQGSGSMLLQYPDFKPLFQQQQIPDSVKQEITGLIQARMKGDVDNAANTGGRKSTTNIVEMLKDLSHQFEQELRDQDALNIGRKNAYDMLMEFTQGRIDALTDEIKVGTGKVGDHKQVIGENDGDIGGFNREIKENVHIHELESQLLAERTQKWEISDKKRENQILALGSGIKMLDGMVAASGKHKDKLIQIIKKRNARSFLQTFTSTGVTASQSAKLKELQTKANSHMVNSVVALLHAGTAAPVPQRVITIISDMVGRLEREHAESAALKQYCDKNLYQNESTRNELTSDIWKMWNSVAKEEAEANGQTKKMKAHDVNMAEKRDEIAEDKKQRLEDNKVNMEVVADCKGAIDSCANALDQLNVVQENNPGGQAVVTLVTLTKEMKAGFEDLLETTNQRETSQLEKHEDFVHAMEQGVRSETRRKEQSELKRQGHQQVAAGNKEDIGTKKKSLKAALVAFDSLQNECEGTSLKGEQLTPEERKAFMKARTEARDNEIEALKTVCDILGTSCSGS